VPWEIDVCTAGPVRPEAPAKKPPGRDGFSGVERGRSARLDSQAWPHGAEARRAALPSAFTHSLLWLGGAADSLPPNAPLASPSLSASRGPDKKNAGARRT